MVSTKKGEFILATTVGGLLAITISILQNVTLAFIPLLILITTFLVLKNKLQLYIVSGILITLFCFSTIFGIDTFVYLTLDRILIICIIMLYFTTQRKHEKLSDFEKLFLIFSISIIIPTLLISNSYGVDSLALSIRKILLMFIEYFIYFYVLRRVMDKQDGGKILKFTLIWGCIVGIYGLVEYFTQKNFLFDFVLQHGYSFNTNYEETFLWGQTRGGILRAKSTFSHSLEFAGILTMLVPFVLYFFTTTKRKLFKLMLFVLLIILIGSVVAAISRSILVINLLIIVMFFLLTKSVSYVKKFYFLFLLMVGVIIAYFSLFSFFFPDGTTNDLSLAQRSDNILNAFTVIKENILFGIGYGNSEATRLVFDNYYFSLLVQSGIVGLGLFLLTFVFLLVVYFKKMKKEKNLLISNLYLAILLFVLTFILLNLAFDAMGFVTVGKVFFFILAASLSFENRIKLLAK